MWVDGVISGFKDLTGVLDGEKHKHANWRVHGIADNAARSFVAETDAAIRSAINKRMGRDDWDLDELKGRVEIITFQHRPGVEVYSLDGQPLITLHPPQSELVDNKIILKRSCEFHD